MIVLSLLVALAIEDRDVVLHNRVPTRVAAILSKALGPDGPLLPTKAGANAEDKRSIIHLHGETEVLDKVSPKLSLFDQPRTRIAVKATIRSRMDKMRNDYILDLENGSDWKMTDSETGISVRLWPLIQENGTIKVYAQFIKEGRTWRTVTVVRSKEILVLRPSGIAVSKPTSLDLAGQPLAWSKVEETKGDARKWYVTEGPDPELESEKVATIEAFPDPIFSASFEPVTSKKS